MPSQSTAARQLLRRRQVASLYLQGCPMHEIATTLRASPNTIFNDLTSIRQDWIAATLQDFDNKKAQELAKIDHLESVAWTAWHRSCEDAEMHRKRQEFVREFVKKRGAKRGKHRLIPTNVVNETTSKGQSGDPRFLDRVAWCVETRLKLMGLLKGDSQNVNILTINWDQMAAAPSGPNPVSQALDQYVSSIQPELQNGAPPIPPPLTLPANIDPATGKYRGSQNNPGPNRDPPAPAT